MNPSKIELGDYGELRVRHEAPKITVYDNGDGSVSVQLHEDGYTILTPRETKAVVKHIKRCLKQEKKF